MNRQMACMYSNQSNPIINDLIRHGRERFNQSILMSRQDGLRKAIKALRDGIPFYYSPDMDFGAKDAVFAPFFGVPAATVIGLSRLAKVSGARIVLMTSQLTPEGYHAEILGECPQFSLDDLEADARALNALVESQVLRFPAQYYWVHRRFKTRPEGQPGVYGDR